MPVFHSSAFVGEHLACFIEYGDTCYLNNQEEADDWEHFVAQYPDGATFHVATDYADDFGRCAVSGALCNRNRIDVLVPAPFSRKRVLYQWLNADISEAEYAAAFAEYPDGFGYDTITLLLSQCNNWLRLHNTEARFFTRTEYR
jgi:hypothetical protein